MSLRYSVTTAPAAIASTTIQPPPPLDRRERIDGIVGEPVGANGSEMATGAKLAGGGAERRGSVIANAETGAGRGGGLDQASGGGQELPAGAWDATSSARTDGGGAERTPGGGGGLLSGGKRGAPELAGDMDRVEGGGGVGRTLRGGGGLLGGGSLGGHAVCVCAMVAARGNGFGGGNETGMFTGFGSSSSSPATTLSGNHSVMPGCQIKVSASITSRRKRSSSCSSVSCFTSLWDIRTCQSSSSAIGVD